MNKVALNLSKFTDKIKTNVQNVNAVFGPKNMKRVWKEIKEGYEFYNNVDRKKDSPFNMFTRTLLNPNPEAQKVFQEWKLNPEEADLAYAGIFANLAGIAGKTLVGGTAAIATGKAVSGVSDMIKKNKEKKEKQTQVVSVPVADESHQNNQQFVDAFSKLSFEDQLAFFKESGECVPEPERRTYAEYGRELLAYIREDEGYLKPREAAGLALLSSMLQYPGTEKLAEEALGELADLDAGEQMDILASIAEANFPEEILAMVDGGEIRNEVVAELQSFRDAANQFEKVAFEGESNTPLSFLIKAATKYLEG